MDAWYYLHEGRQVGPISLSELTKLAENGVIQNWTQVWSPGMEEWCTAGEVEGLFPAPQAPPAPVQPSTLRGEDGRSEPPPSIPPREYTAPGVRPTVSYTHVDTHLTKAILATLLCCMPLGIVAIVKAAQVKAKLEDGQIEEAQRLSREADNWGNWSILLGLVVSVLYLAVMLVGGGLD
jgi:hypothetical protein